MLYGYAKSTFIGLIRVTEFSYVHPNYHHGRRTHRRTDCYELRSSNQRKGLHHKFVVIIIIANDGNGDVAPTT